LTEHISSPHPFGSLHRDSYSRARLASCACFGPY
jgi:hypothetical protein